MRKACGSRRSGPRDGRWLQRGRACPTRAARSTWPVHCVLCAVGPAGAPWMAWTGCTRCDLWFLTKLIVVQRLASSVWLAAHGLCAVSCARCRRTVDGLDWVHQVCRLHRWLTHICWACVVEGACRGNP